MQKRTLALGALLWRLALALTIIYSVFALPAPGPATAARPLDATESSPVDRPADDAARSEAAPTASLTATTPGPIFWDTPPEQGTVVRLSTGEEFIQPGPGDVVRVIILLEGEPVAAYTSRVRAALANEEGERVSAYAAEVQREHERFLALAGEGGIALKPGQQFSYLLNGLAAAVKMGDVERIRTLPEVQSVSLDYQVEATLAQSVPLIGAPQVWALRDGQGRLVTGKGIRVAVLDTGIDYNHPDLGGGFGAGHKVAGGWDFVNNDADPMDDEGHGTHVAGIVSANGTLKGVAPDSTLYAYKVLNSQGSGSSSFVIAALERAADPDGNPSTHDALDVVNLSLSARVGTADDPMSLAVDAAVEQGIVVVVAAGNSGPDYYSVQAPALARKAFSVGSTDKSDQIVESSARGPVSNLIEMCRPSIVAPGADINSTALGGGQQSLGGTSMAAPHVAGAVALLKQLHPAWSTEMLQANLMNTAKDLALDVYTQGAGRVQVDRAASAPGVLTPPAIGLGFVDASRPLWTQTRELRLTNTATSAKTYALAVRALPSGVTSTLSPTRATLQPGEGITVTLVVTVNNAQTPYQEPGFYRGEVVAQSESRALVVPIFFVKSARLELDFDQEPYMVLIHDRTMARRSQVRPGDHVTAPLPQGTYDVCVLYDEWFTWRWVVKEGIVVTQTTSLSIATFDAAHTLYVSPRDQNGLSVRTEFAVFHQYLQHTPSGLAIDLGTFDCSGAVRVVHLSPASADYRYAWRLDAVGDSAWYEFNGSLTGISGDSLYRNDPAALRRVVYQFHPTPGQTALEIQEQISDSALGRLGLPRLPEPLAAPFRKEAYFIPFADSSLPRRFTRVEARDPASGRVLLASPLFVVRPGEETDLYVPMISERAGVTYGDEIHIGQSPPYWAGFFYNDWDFISLWPPSIYARFFHDQSQGLTAYDAVPCTLYRNGLVVGRDTLPAGDADWESPPPVNSLRFPLTAAGAYSLTLSYDGCWIGSQPCRVQVVADLDTRRGDNAPPNLLSLNVLCNGRTTDRVPPATPSQVRFRVADAGGLGPVTAFYQAGGGWVAAPLAQQGDAYTAQLPGLPAGSRVALRVVARDGAGNALTYEATPAFVVEIGAPALLTPADGSATQERQVRLTWDPAAGAAGYRIQVDRAATFTSTALISETVHTTSYTPTLPAGAWYWRVLALDSTVGTGAPSATWRIDVVDPPIQITTHSGSDTHPALMQSREGKLWVIWSRDGQLYYRTSIDGGASWSAEGAFPTTAGRVFRPAAIQAADGRLWVVYESYEDGPQGIEAMTSTDEGASWDRRLLVSTGAVERSPTLAQARDGRLVLAWTSTRTGREAIWCKTSTDGGNTWSPEAQLVDDPVQSEGADLLRTADGKLWLVWRAGDWPCVCFTAGLSYRTSDDNGVTWSEVRRLTQTGDGTEPALAEGADGTLHLMWRLGSSSTPEIWQQMGRLSAGEWSAPARRRWTYFLGADSSPDMAGLLNGSVGVAWESTRSGNTDIWFGLVGLRQDVDAPPYVSDVAHGPDLNPGERDVVSFTARVADESAVARVALLWNRDGVAQPELAMVDDGAHGDGQAGDGLYGVQAGPWPKGTRITYRVSARDSGGHAYTWPVSPAEFTVLPAFEKTAGILLVPDTTGLLSYDLVAECTRVLDVLGYPYDLWDPGLRGMPGSAVFDQYTRGVIILASADDSYFSWDATYVQYSMRSNLIRYLGAGGRLFIFGRQVPRALAQVDESFLAKYLHAGFERDYSEGRTVFGALGDPIGDGLTLIGVYGGSVIEAIAPAVSVLTLDGSGETVGLRVDTGAYKVVLYGINWSRISGLVTRQWAMDRALTWLSADLPAATPTPTVTATPRVTPTLTATRPPAAAGVHLPLILRP